MRSEGPYFSAREGKHKYCFNGRASSQSWPTREAAAREYVKQFLQVNEKYRPLVAGKAWPEVFRVLGITI